MDETYTIMKKAHAEFTEYLNMVDTDMKWMKEGEVEVVITDDADEEIVWDRVDRALAFLDPWSVILSDGLVDQDKGFQNGDTHKPVPQLQWQPSCGAQDRGGMHPAGLS